MDSVKSNRFVDGNSQEHKVAVVQSVGWDSESEGLEKPVKRLTKEEAQAILGERALAPSKLTTKRLLALQLVVTIVSSVLWSAKGKGLLLNSAAVSALIGGFCALIPAVLFAARVGIVVDKVRAAGAGGVVFALVTGELLKIVVTVALFGLAIGFYEHLEWLPLLLTYILAIKCYMLVWFVK